jgi:protein-S-isoprenylcysteine O-methyltransferase Ste14
MTSQSQSSSGSTGPVPDVANLGLVRPPLVYLASILLGLLLHVVWPLPLVRRAVGAPIGAAVVLIAIGLFIASVRAFRAAGTPVPGNRPTTTIVPTGPYRFSRNPIYLAFSTLQVGLALWVSSLWLLVTLVPALALMSLWVIPREERYLEGRFPSEYLPYKSSVRRWV